MNKPDKVFLAVFSRTPILGQVKTRLQPELNAQQALRCHELLLQQTLQQVHTFNAQIELWTAPTIHHPLFEQLAEQYALQRYQQQGKDLGKRMLYCLKRHVENNETVVLIGSDCPQIDHNYLQQAVDALDTVDVVLGPARDGGYVLIACRRIDVALFEDIHWGTDQVLAQTRARLESSRLSYTCLQPLDDIDTYSDLQHYPDILQTLLP